MRLFVQKSTIHRNYIVRWELAKTVLIRHFFLSFLLKEKNVSKECGTLSPVHAFFWPRTSHSLPQNDISISGISFLFSTKLSEAIAIPSKALQWSACCTIPRTPTVVWYHGSFVNLLLYFVNCWSTIIAGSQLKDFPAKVGAEVPCIIVDPHSPFYLVGVVCSQLHHCHRQRLDIHIFR